MATNPSYQGTGTQLSGQNPVNDPKPKSHVGYNKFKRSYPHVTTARYGDVTPFYVDDAVENDKVPLASMHDVRTPTMVSPFLGEIAMKKAYFDVPLRAIYPLNYDLMRVPPVAGDDIPQDNMCYIDGSTLNAFLNRYLDMRFLSGDAADHADFVRALLVLEKFMSKGSLFEYLGAHLGSIATWRWRLIGPEYPAERPFGLAPYYSSFDLLFEAIVDNIFQSPTNGYFIRIQEIDGGPWIYPYAARDYVDFGGVINFQGFQSMHWILERLRENPWGYEIQFVNVDNDHDLDLAKDLDTIMAGITWSWDSNTPLNLERLVAYQLACSEYMTDDHIDNIYTTDLFRQMMSGFLEAVFPMSFIRNGVTMPYDIFSKAYVSEVFSRIDAFEQGSNFQYYLWNLVTIRKSLRFEDYFVGGRLQPLAVGDVSAPVVGNGVDAFEMVKSMVYVRYLNAVNLSGPEFDTYSKEVLKNTPPPRADVPKFLGMTKSLIRGYEVENTTSDDQGKIVTNINTSDERFAFSVNMDHESILLGVCFFEVRRLYSKSVERRFYQVDRYDKFVPKLQYLGDQDISLAELRAGEPLDEPFAYGVRNGDLKQRVGVVSGGVVDFLKSWTMVTDVIDSYDNNSNLDSDYIRSKNVEFDRFFNTSNNSLAGYFHFILTFNNVSDPIRPMDVAPEILM